MMCMFGGLFDGFQERGEFLLTIVEFMSVRGERDEGFGGSKDEFSQGYEDFLRIEGVGEGG